MATAYLWVTTPSGSRQRKHVAGKTREKVREKYLKLHEASRRGPVTTKVPSLSQSATGWVGEVIAPCLPPATIASYRMCLRLCRRGRPAICTTPVTCRSLSRLARRGEVLDRTWPDVDLAAAEARIRYRLAAGPAWHDTVSCFIRRDSNPELPARKQAPRLRATAHSTPV